MKKIAGILFSSQLMGVVLMVFALSAGIATFIENDFGSPSARALVYNARWFELLLLLGSVNIVGRIIIKRLYTWQKIPIFLFHASFVIILAGAAITRYTGWEGTLSVREGQTTNRILIDKTFINLTAQKDTLLKSFNFRTSFTPSGKNRFNSKIGILNNEYELKVKSFLPNAYLTIQPHYGGIPVAEIIFADSTGRKSTVVSKGESTMINGLPVSFEANNPDSNAVNLLSRNDSLYFTAPYPVVLAGMGSDSFTELEEHRMHFFNPGFLYRFQEQMLVLKQYYAEGKVTARQVPHSDGLSFDAVTMELSGEKGQHEIILMGKSGYQGLPHEVSFDGINFLISYGSRFQTMPFEITLDDFLIERYPGSRSPSSFESRVTLTDAERNISDKRRIYMNNILKYRGYRFYQTSYDPDEKGTILSVNHDQAGTMVTYAGYAVMAAGMILSIFSRQSRFRKLVTRKKQRAQIVATLLFLIAAGQVSAQDGAGNGAVIPADKDHARQFGRLLIQDNDGRIEPLNTLSAEVMRKLIRTNTYKGMNADQVFLGMLSDPAVWQYEPVIRATHPDIRKMLGSQDKYFSFAGFFDNNNNYILESTVGEAYRKKPAERSKFDNELIRLDERINICYLVFSGELLKIFPAPGDSARAWYNHSGIQGKVMTEDSVFTASILYHYAQEVQKSVQSGNWTNAGTILTAITQYQQKYAGDIIPSQLKIRTEVFLNNADNFSRISKYYGITGFLLLILLFARMFNPHIKLRIPIIAGMALIIVLFLIHTSGLVLRWYVSGHAPLSNGYEALTYVAWATVLAGLVFAFRSTITLSVTAILASLILFVAHLSWMDPQITNLVPVLKSYWLVIHVATITASYGFLGMCALLGFLNLLLMIGQSNKNKEYLQSTIKDLTETIEMSMIIGLYLLTIGVFLGAVWANESWGRYWGWDPKETWALVTVIVYAFVVHMRMIPGFKGTYAFNLASVVAFSSVIMTYFGVNYYLSGLHSYAAGDPLPVPTFVYYALAIMISTAITAYIKRPDHQETGDD